MAVITPEDMHVSKYIHPCTPQHALEVGFNLRSEDRREVEETMGLAAPAAVLQSYYNSDISVYFTSPHGKAVGVAGVTAENIIWMLCTNEGDNHPHTFVREARRWVNSLDNPYLLYSGEIINIGLERYTFSGLQNIADYKKLRIPIISYDFLRILSLFSFFVDYPRTEFGCRVGGTLRGPVCVQNMLRI